MKYIELKETRVFLEIALHVAIFSFEDFRQLTDQSKITVVLCAGGSLMLFAFSIAI